MIIGGHAVLVHGEPRLTRDIDIPLGVDPVALPLLLDSCATLRLHPLIEEVETFVRRTFVLPVLDAGKGVRVHFIFSTTPYEAEAIRRATPRELEGTPVPFASAEDLILHKLFAGRPRDDEDGRGESEMLPDLESARRELMCGW